MSDSPMKTERHVDACDILVKDEVILDGEYHTVAKIEEIGSLVEVRLIRPDKRKITWIYTFDEPVTVRRVFA